MKKQHRPWLVVAASSLLAWASAIVGLVSYITAPTLAAVVGWLVIRRYWRPLALLLVTSPFVAASTLAVFGYASGTARLRTVGLPDLELYNVNPTTRYQAVSSGCIVDGSEWVMQFPNNATLLALSVALGPMPGAYTGPYPGRRHIADAFRTTRELNWRDVEKDRVHYGSRVFQLRQGLGAQLTTALRSSSSNDLCCRPSVAVWQHRVLLLRFPPESAEFVNEEDALIVIVDGNTGKIIAYQGNPGLRRRELPRQWT